MKIRSPLVLLTGAVVTCSVAVNSSAAIESTSSLNTLFEPTFGGTTQFDGWDNLSINNPQIANASSPFPSFPGGSPWPEAIESLVTQDTSDTSDDDVTGDATFNKTFGNGYPATFSIYASPFPPGGSYVIEDATPVAGLENVFFQIKIGQGSASGPGFDPWLSTLPSLTLNGVPLGEADNSGVFSAEIQDVGFGDSSVANLGFQWDLSGTTLADAGITGPVTSLAINYAPSGTSTATVDLRLDQSSEFSFVVIPEPASLALVGLGGLSCLGRRRRY